MSSKKIVKMTLITIAITIGICFIWWLLLRPANATPDRTLQYFTMHQSACQQIATYLTKHNYTTSIYGTPSSDHNFGIRKEDSSDYLQFSNNISELFGDDCFAVFAEGNAIRIATQKTGGIFCKKHAELIYSADSCLPFFDAFPTRDIHWYYRIVSDT